MENNNNKTFSGHNIKLENRNKFEATGVINVLTFNEDNVILNTSLGILNIHGKNMKVNKLNVDNGDVTIVGEIYSLIYSSKEAKGNFMKKLFK